MFGIFYSWVWYVVCCLFPIDDVMGHDFEIIMEDVKLIFGKL